LKQACPTKKEEEEGSISIVASKRNKENVFKILNKSNMQQTL